MNVKIKKNLELPFIIESVENSELLLIAFAGLSGGVGIHPFEFFNITKGFNIDKIFIRDFDQSWYHSGIENISNSAEGTAKYLLNIIKSHNYKKVVCIGNSMGGYAALLIGKLIKADTIIAFAPQIFLDNLNREKYNDTIAVQQIANLPKNIKKEYLNLSLLLNNSTIENEIHIYYSSNHLIDVAHIEQLDKNKFIFLHPYDKGGHHIVQLLKNNGELYNILRNNLTDFSGDRIVSIFEEIEGGCSISKAIEKHNVKKELFLEYKNKYSNLINFKSKTLYGLFSDIVSYITNKTAYNIVNNKLIENNIYTLDFCTQWFSSNPNRKQMFGVYIDINHSDYLVNVQVATKNLHIGLVKYQKKDNLIEIIKMNQNDFQLILSKYNNNLGMQPRNWGAIWCSVDCGSFYDLSRREVYLTITDFFNSECYKNIFQQLIENMKCHLKYNDYLNNLYRPPLEKGKTKEFLCLDKNEPPFSAFDYIEGLFCDEDILKLREYPNLYDLYEKLSKFSNVEIDNLLLTQGSEQALKSVFDIFVEEGDEVVYYYPSFAMYDVFSYQKKAKVIHLNFEDNRNMNINDIIKKVTNGTKLFSLISPHNFTGTALNYDEVKAVVEHTKKTGTIFLLDEAYYHYDCINSIDFIKNNKHVIITRTFSKALGIAGARVGYAISNKENIDLLRKVKPIDEIDYLAGVIAKKTLDNADEILNKNISQVKKWQNIFKIEELLNLEYLDTKANFILLKSIDYEYHKELLLKNKIIAKVKFDVKCLKNCIRFSIVDDENMQMILNLFKKVK